MSQSTATISAKGAIGEALELDGACCSNLCLSRNLLANVTLVCFPSPHLTKKFYVSVMLVDS